MFESRVVVCAVLVASLVVACKSKQAEPAQPKPVEPTGATVQASATAPASAPTTTYSAGDPRGAKDPFSAMSIGDRLATESSQRPKIDPNVDTFFGKLKKQGLNFAEETQVAGWPVSAKYCGRGALTTGIYLVVCEYPDAASAKKGGEISSGISKTVEHREVFVHKELTMAIQQTVTAPLTVADAKKIKDTFQSL